MRFIVTTHTALPGVRLSRPGHFGNLPFDNVPEAEAHARAIAGSADITVDQEHARPRSFIVDRLANPGA
jgi:hypothetical protein